MGHRCKGIPATDWVCAHLCQVQQETRNAWKSVGLQSWFFIRQSLLCNTVTQRLELTTSREAHGSRGFGPQLPGTTVLDYDEEDHPGREHGDSRAAHFVVAGKQRVRRDPRHGISFTGMLPIKTSLLSNSIRLCIYQLINPSIRSSVT